MKKILILLFVLISILKYGASQQVIPSSTRIYDDQQKMEIKYDLDFSIDAPSHDIQVKITSRGVIVKAVHLSGDFGANVTRGKGKTIIWNAIADDHRLDSSYEVSITFIPGKIPCKLKSPVPSYIGLAVSIGTGASLIVAGLKSKSEADDLYEIYENNTYSQEAAVYRTMSREEHYDEANSKHKKSQWMTWGGAGIIAAGGTFMIMKLMKINKHNRDCRNTSTSNWKVDPFIMTGQGGAAGFSLSYSF